MDLRNIQCFVFYFFSVLNIGYGKFIVKRAEMCDKNINYPLKGYAQIRTDNDKQFVSGNSTLGVPFDDSIRGNITVEMIRGKNDIINLLSRNEVNGCTTVHKYFGEFMREVERNVGHTPGRCPIPKGKYEVHDYPLNFDLIPSRAIPYGNLRFRAYAVKGNNVLSCAIVDVENRLK